MAGIGIRNVFGPASHVQPQRDGMVLSEYQTALARQLDLGLIWENPRPRGYDVSFQPKDGLENFVPNRKRNACVVFCLARSPARQKILIVDEESAVLE